MWQVVSAWIYLWHRTGQCKAWILWCLFNQWFEKQGQVCIFQFYKRQIVWWNLLCMTAVTEKVCGKCAFLCLFYWMDRVTSNGNVTSISRQRLITFKNIQELSKINSWHFTSTRSQAWYVWGNEWNSCKLQAS